MKDKSLVNTSRMTSDSAKGRDKRSGSNQTQKKLVGDTEDEYGIGYLNPAFVENNTAGTPATAHPGSLLISVKTWNNYHENRGAEL